MIELLFRTAENPWSQEVLLGVAWELLWVAFGVGVLFLIGHLIWAAKWAPDDEFAESPSPEPRVAAEARLRKHTLAARLFHWIMAAAIFVLLITAFFPVLGIQFPWVTIHWIAGIVLTASIVYHVVHSTFWLDFWSMWIDRSELRDTVNRAKRFLGKDAPAPRKPGKYPLENKLFHHTNVVAGFGVIVTGILMMFRVETPFWDRNPYLFSDATWGVVYVIHGLCSVAFVTMVMAHIYFAVRPEKLWITRGMIKGWITGEEYARHHDPERWRPEAAEGRPTPPEPAGSGAPAGYEAAD